MAKKYAAGIDGSVTFLSGQNARFDRWEATYSQRAINITGFDSGGDEENQGGIRFGRGSCTGHITYGAASTSPGTGALANVATSITLTVATGCTIAHSALCSDIALSSDVNGEARVTFNWLKSGVITETWAVS